MHYVIILYNSLVLVCIWMIWNVKSRRFSRGYLNPDKAVLELPSVSPRWNWSLSLNASRHVYNFAGSDGPVVGMSVNVSVTPSKNACTPAFACLHCRQVPWNGECFKVLPWCSTFIIICSIISSLFLRRSCFLEREGQISPPRGGEIRCVGWIGNKCSHYQREVHAINPCVALFLLSRESHCSCRFFHGCNCNVLGTWAFCNIFHYCLQTLTMNDLHRWWAGKSPNVMSLSGEWKFLLLPRPEEVPEGFFNPPFEDSAWQSIPGWGKRLVFYCVSCIRAATLPGQCCSFKVSQTESLHQRHCSIFGCLNSVPPTVLCFSHKSIATIKSVPLPRRVPWRITCACVKVKGTCQSNAPQLPAPFQWNRIRSMRASLWNWWISNIICAFCLHSMRRWCWVLQFLPTGSFIPRLAALSRTLRSTPTFSTPLTWTLLLFLSPIPPHATEETSQFPRRGKVRDSGSKFIFSHVCVVQALQGTRHHVANTLCNKKVWRMKPRPWTHQRAWLLCCPSARLWHAQYIEPWHGYCANSWRPQCGLLTSAC